MTDTKTISERSRNMAAVKNMDTTPELFVRRLLFSMGFRYRLGNKKLPGRPDIVLKKYRVAVFVNGCFWHGHIGCKKSKLPTTNSKFWENKISANRKRDKVTIDALLANGYRVLVVWQCVCKKRYIEKLSHIIKNFLLGNSSDIEIEFLNSKLIVKEII